MAFTDVTALFNSSLKKQKSYFATELDVTNSDVGLVTKTLLLANLPPIAILLDAYAFRLTASDAATSATLKLGTTDGGAEIMAAADLKGTGKVGSLVAAQYTGSGKGVYATLTITGAQTAGKFIVVIDYLEPGKTTGELTRV